MSGLTFKGNITSNVGEYLPAPYIDQVVVEGEDTFRFKYSVFFIRTDMKNCFSLCIANASIVRKIDEWHDNLKNIRDSVKYLWNKYIVKKPDL